MMVNITKAQANQLRAMMEKAAASLSDQDASTVPLMFGRYKTDGSLLSAGSRINWNGQLKRAAVDLWQTEANSPDNAPTLWEDIDYKDGYRIIPETITAGTAFALDEYGWWTDGNLYKSLLEANVWTPEVNPDGWKMVEGGFE